MEYLILGSLMVLALGFLMSISFMAVHHVLIIIPIFYFLPKTNWKRLKINNWALIIFALILPITIALASKNEITLGYFNIMKFKYYLIGALMGAPLAWWFKTKATEKQIRAILWAALISSSLASLAGMIALYTGFNPLKMAPPTSLTQNCGMFGMLMSYAHSEAILCVLLVGVILNYKNTFSKYIPMWLLASASLINLAGFITSYTRGALLAFILAIPFYFFKAHKKTFISAILISAVTAGVAFLAVPKIRVIFEGRQHSNLMRVGQWKAALKVFELNPIMGVGFRNFQPYSVPIKTQYGYPIPEWEGHAHNNFLEIAAGTGLVGLIPFCIWIFGWLIQCYKRNDLAARMMFPAIIAILIGGITQNTITDGVNVFLFMTLYALTQIEVHTP
jgi:O-antigen ligase